MLGAEVTMLFRALVLVGLLFGSALGAAVPEDPFQMPDEFRTYVRLVTNPKTYNRAKLQALLSAIFRPVADGGLGITYDNERTRTIQEVWKDRKANCLSMTAFYVAAARSVGIDASYAEALNTNRWRKVGSVVRFERHVVALSRSLPNEDLIADFIPTLRRRSGIYVVVQLGEQRFRALYHSNRAVELLGEGELESAKAEAQTSLNADAKCSIGWNIMGVVQAACGETTQAEQSYRAALAADPQDTSAIGNLDMLLRASGRVEEAAKYRALGENLRKKDPYFNAFLGEEALAENNLVEAEQRILAALKLLPHESEFHLTHARLKLLQGKTDDAVKAIQEAKRWGNPQERERYDNKLAIIKGKGDQPK